MAERNLVRYYFAFMAYFHGQSLTDPTQRYEQQLKDWFEHTEKFTQLYEMSEQEYLEAKRKERKNQLILQTELATPDQE